MSNLLTKMSATAFALVLALPAHAGEELGPDSVVATVNGTEITLGHMLSVRAALPQQYQQLPNDALWDGILDQLVRQTVLSQQDTAVETRRIKLALENEKRALLAAEALTTISKSAVSEADVAKAYEDNYVNGTPGTEYNASHILVETKEEADAIAQQINDGADFAELARTKSTGPSGPNGGSLGWFGAGMMVAPFQAAVEALEVGQVSEPVQTQFGWHVIKLNETRAKEVPALEKVRGEIEQQLQQAAIEKALNDLVAASAITRTEKTDVDTSVLRKIELLEN